MIWRNMIVALVLAGWLLGPGLAFGQKVRFATSVVAPIYHVPVMAAKEKGFWKEQGVEVDWVSFRSSTVAYKGVAAAEVDMGAVTPISAIQGVIRGVPLLVVADLHTPYEVYLWVRADSPIKEAKDLNGARIGVTGLGGMTHTYGRLVTKALGLEKEVKFVAAGGLREQVAALKSGAIDVTVLTFLATAPLKLKGEIRELLLVQDFLPKEWSENILVARKEFASKSPNLVSGSIRGFFRATDFLQRNRAWAIERMKSSFGYSEEVAQAIYPKLVYGKDGKINPAALSNIVNFLVEFGIVPKEKVPPVDKLYDRSFLE